MKTTDFLQIENVSAQHVTEVLAFMTRVRKEVFPMFNPDQLPADLINIHQHYIEAEDAAIFAAVSAEGHVIGTIAVHRYDDRIEELRGSYDVGGTAEFVKCYVDSQLRRRGIGLVLVREAMRFCEAAGYRTAYLHTHRFLPGAVSFWEHHGFRLRLEEQGGLETIHMDRTV